VSTETGVEVTISKTAVMFVVPTARAVASPFDPVALLIVATDMLDEFQVAHVVRLCVLLSIKVPVAVNCCVNPWGTFTVPGVTAIACTREEVSVAEPVALSNVASIVACPEVEPAVAKPIEPTASLTVPLPGFKDVQVAKGVRF
jgi:hypothetical protein